MEEANPELKSRVASALEAIGGFVDRYRSELGKRKGRLIQTSGFKEETRSMEAAIQSIDGLLKSGRNISAIFAAIDGFLERYGADESFAREHTRTQLADVRESFMSSFHASVRGTRLGGLLDVLYFMPYSCWRSRDVERRSFRSPSAAEVLRLLEELGRRGVDVNGIDIAQLAAVIRLKLGITPRMDYHLMTGNKLAAQLTSEEAIARFASREVPLDEGLCRTAGRVLANLRRCSADCFGSGSSMTPEIEAELVQIAILSADTLRIGGGKEQGPDYLWLRSTVVAGAQAPLRDALAALADGGAGQPLVRQRLADAKACLDQLAVAADRVLLSRWSAARQELASLVLRADAIASKSTHEFGEFTELETLKEQRSEAVKSLIKISEALRLLESTLLEPGASAAAPPGGLPADAPSGAPEPAELKGRNRALSEETAKIAREELGKLRSLIARITALSRSGLAGASVRSARERPGAGGQGARRTADGAVLGGMPAAALQERLLDLLQKVGRSLGELKGKVEGAKKRSFKPDLQHALAQFSDKLRNAAECCDGSGLDAVDAARAPAIAERILPLLREIMSALTNAGTRVGNARLTPAEKQPLVALLHGVKSRVGDDLRDLEKICAELAERTAEAAGGPPGDEAPVQPAVPSAPREVPVESAAAPEEAVEEPAAAHEEAARPAREREMESLVSAANQALKPVKDLMLRLTRSMSAGKPDHRAVLATARALKSGGTEARDVVTWNLRQCEALAAKAAVEADAHAAKFDRWTGQLLALDGEAERLLKAAEPIAELEAAVRDAVALEQGISDTVRVLSVRDPVAEELGLLRERCAAALGTITALQGQVRHALESLAGAGKADWRVLKAAPGYLAAGRAQLAAGAAELSARQPRIQRVLKLLESGPRGGPQENLPRP